MTAHLFVLENEGRSFDVHSGGWVYTTTFRCSCGKPANMVASGDRMGAQMKAREAHRKHAVVFEESQTIARILRGAR